ncbi:O-antigen ligase family protein [Hirschia litorea]|uniref:O-antigen ligase family protein n=1 Tax=Hirschia litorea TaxID=1199156 RepID=A0ABW2IGM0_9PROT
MLSNDTYISKWHPPIGLKLTPIELTERVLVFFVTLTYSGLWVALLLGPSTESPGMMEVDPGPVARASWFPAYLCLLGLLAVKYKQFFAAIIRFWPVLLLILLTFLSITWSINPEITQRRVIALSFTFFFGMYLAIRAPFLDTLKIIAIAYLCIAIINLLVIVGIPSWGIHSELHVGAWRGFMLEKNHMGGEMARANLLFLALLFYDGKHDNGDIKKIWWVGLGLTFLLVLGSTSKTSLIAMIVPYLGLVFYQIAIRTPILAIIAIWVGLSIAGIGYAVLAIAPEFVVSLIGKDLTFTGRTDIWILVIDLINQHKFTGYGYGVFWKDPDGPSADIVTILDWKVPTAHNSWLEIGLSLGYTGLALVVVFTLFGLIKGAFLATGKHGPFPFLIVFQLVLFSLSESLLLTQNSSSSALFFYALSYICIARKIAPDLDIPKISAPRWAQKPRTTRRR